MRSGADCKPSFEQVLAAWERRKRWIAADTDAYRLLDEAGDGVPEVEIDHYAGRWIVATRNGKCPDWLKEYDWPGVQAIYWKSLDPSEKLPPRWVCREQVTEPFVVHENGLKFEISFQTGYSQGIFLDQRLNRKWVMEHSRGLSVLNCFSYTCGFGMAAAAGGAERVVNLDLSKPYLEWGRRNYHLNGLPVRDQDFIYGDTFDWLKRFARQGKKFGGIILDPPTFSRSNKDQKRHVFRAEKDLGELVRAAMEVLEEGGWMFVSTNCRILTEPRFLRLVEAGMISQAEPEIKVLQMSPEFCGRNYLKACLAWKI